MITFILAVCGNVDYVYSFPQSPPSRAAWIEIEESLPLMRPTTSPPSRAAWIEIVISRTMIAVAMCRRLHGRRGLKLFFLYDYTGSEPSPPSRAAWIEMTAHLSDPPSLLVAAFTGGVD